MYCAHCGSPRTSSTCPVCGQVTTSTDTSLYAGWWRRVGATLSDDLILAPVTLAVLAFLTPVAGGYAGAFIGLCLQGLYMVKLLARPAGQTLGNRVANTQVRDAITGGPLTQNQALKRWGFIALYSLFELISPWGFIVVFLVGLLDDLYPLFDDRRQTLHDKFAGTIVVRAPQVI